MSAAIQSEAIEGKQTEGSVCAGLAEQQKTQPKRRKNASKEREAMAFAINHLTVHGIKPDMTLKEYAEFTNQSLRQIQSDATRGYLPLLKPVTKMDKELKRVNVAAIYAAAYIEGAEYIGRVN
ncbi:TPA: hypothetical protein KEY88_003445 [Serratia marcescens]|nr:hypothetical protein [Serratia marcescens]